MADSVKLIVSLFGLLGIFGGLGFGSLIFAIVMAVGNRNSRSKIVIIAAFLGINNIDFVLNRKILLNAMVFR